MAATKIKMPTPMSELSVRGFIRTQHRAVCIAARPIDNCGASQGCVRHGTVLTCARKTYTGDVPTSGPLEIIMNGKTPKSPSGTPRADVAEFQGLYGAFEFPERLLQKIWHLGFFLRSALATTDGRAIEIVSGGEWNLAGGGPDFKGAQLRIGGREILGDVELHFYPRDWRSHGHHHNPAFDNVVLHVSLFAPDYGDAGARTSKGTRIPLLVLLPHLTCSIEEFALEDALEKVTGAGARNDLSEFLRKRPPSDVIGELTRLARARWEQKVGFAQLRIDRLGWDGACHHTALEILGYRHNRAPMLSVAEVFPLATWTGEVPDVERLWECGGSRWRVLGARPANHPRLRLAQYTTWVRAAPDWPSRLVSLARSLPVVADQSPLATTAEIRRRAGFARLREQLAKEIAGGAVSGTRFDTIVTNGFLPLIAARGVAEPFATWCCWFAGDSPDWLKAALRDTPATPGKRPPLCEGLVQAALQFALEQPSAGSLLGSPRRGT